MRDADHDRRGRGGVAIVKLSYATLLTAEVDRLADFYVAGLGLAEVVASRSGRYREVEAGAVRIGIVSDDAYAALGMESEAGPTGIRGILTFQVDRVGQIAPGAERAVAHGATLVQPPGATAFGTVQAVLRDPAGNAFRISAAAGS